MVHRVRQECVMCSWLFNVFMDKWMRNVCNKMWVSWGHKIGVLFNADTAVSLQSFR